MLNQEEYDKVLHDLKRPFSNLQMLITILKVKDMEKEKLIATLLKIVDEGKTALTEFENSYEP